MIWLTHLRTIMIAASAFTFCCGLVTQMMARALGYDASLGPPLLDLGSLRLYAPFSFLKWSMAWASVAPSLLVLSLCLSMVCALASYAVAIVFAKLEPIALAEPSPWRDLASWRELGHYGLLRDEGLALGAVRRHGLARSSIIRSSGRNVVFLGDPQHSDDAVLAALGSWRRHLVLVSGRGPLACKLGRSDVLRFAPGRSDGLSINPLLMLRGGLHAWGDARRLSASLLAGASPADAGTVDTFALVMLDQLLCASIESRTLNALRHRLLIPAALLGELCVRWAVQPADDSIPAIWEMTRAARDLRAEPDAALEHLTRIDQALAIFANAGIVKATSTHHLHLTHLLSAPTPQTLVLATDAMPPNSAPLIYALLAQLAALHTESDAREMLIAVEADAACDLAASAVLRARDGARVLIQNSDLAEAERLLGPNASVVAIGPQSEASAERLSKRAGNCSVLGPLPLQVPRWRLLLFPTWVERQQARLPEAALGTASPAEAFLVAPNQKPVCMRVLIGGGATHFVSSHQTARHDWEGPLLARATTPATPPAAADAAPITPPAASAAKLRRVLTRTGDKPHKKGARIK